MNFVFFKLADEYTLPGLLNRPVKKTSVYPPLGMLYVAAVLEHEGHTVTVIDLGMEELTQEHLVSLLENADAVGISVLTANYQNVALLAASIKDVDPGIPIIIGGPHCHTHKARCLTHVPSADIVVEGEGEGTMPILADALAGKKTMSDVPGVSFRTKNGDIGHGSKTVVVENLDALPFPARHLVAQHEYGHFPWGKAIAFTSLITSRGCPYRCRFCARHSNLIEGYRYRQRSAEKVVEELESIAGKYQTIAVVDDNFLQNVKRAHRIFDLILERGLEFNFRVIGARVDSAEPSLFKKMRKAGVSYISFGVESGNQEVLDFYRKHITLDQIRNAVRLAADEGMFVEATFILGAPIETREMIDKSIDFIQTIPLDNVLIRPLYYEIGDDLWYDAVKEGKLTEDDWEVKSDSCRGLGNFTSDELDNLVKKAYRRFYFSPRFGLRELRQTIAFKDVDRLKSMLKIMSSFQIRDFV